MKSIVLKAGHREPLAHYANCKKADVPLNDDIEYKQDFPNHDGKAQRTTS
ncbi:hypothetical protein HMPREF0454_04314 [Hafnia alvei ATCC 51873]|uniref:Uncharacterized protein n=1 Tax=Hafnia alvei ATCC 51873 TaxID=1002364 RepID=G9YCH7_HAFAL|nr:hypothetical protein HMPREF0454_04314 [Hafnia alvei ATCC 51873]